MMRLVFDTVSVCEWARPLLPDIDPGRSSAIGVVNEAGKMIAAAVFCNFKGHDVEIGFASTDPRWAQRGVIRAIFNYVFNQLGCVRLTTITAETNLRARKLDEGLGFKLEGVHPNGMAPGVTAISYGMQKDECRWL